MGRVPGVSSEAGRWVDGKPEVLGVHRPAAEDPRLYHSVRRGPRLWSHRERIHALHDISVEERQAASIL